MVGLLKKEVTLDITSHTMSVTWGTLENKESIVVVPNYIIQARCISRCHINLLKPTGYVMHQQFNIQQLYVLPTLYLCVLYLSENKQRLVPLTS